jgi:hypothetical protein
MSDDERRLVEAWLDRNGLIRCLKCGSTLFRNDRTNQDGSVYSVLVQCVNCPWHRRVVRSEMG